MSEVPIHACSLPQFIALADLESVANDLRMVVDITRRLIAGEKDMLVMRSLFSSGLISYRRCFNSGVRNSVKRADLALFDGRVFEMHDYLINQANKLIAHSVNPFERTQAGVLVRDEKVIGISTLSAQLVLFDPSQMEQWHRLSGLMLERILLPRIEEARGAALKAAAQLPIQEITAGQPLEYDPRIPPENAGERRS
ncbi:hypothetical protein GWG65_25820 [Bradyrhizobium sp. CSA207]|uniref:hypothetical protein n=1 Tax=Bradyrhizobium sp. CSA207 TaxID=2698826 RepID=UPI0023B063C1|nr:hypothetical protein [Bradyrhizobium sp. CSA207]MDE5444804.1 hypothetical protein [Bradyrhizobium sp. CSA207]